MERAGDVNVILDAVPDMLDWYMRNGFPVKGDTTSYYHVTVTSEMLVPTPVPATSCSVEPLDDQLWPGVVRLDQLTYPSPGREPILRAFLVGDGIHTLVARAAGHVVGFGSIHKMWEGHFGLRCVLAQDAHTADQLIRGLLSDLNLRVGNVVHFPLVGDAAPPGVLALGAVEHVITVTRLYSKHLIPIRHKNIWIPVSDIA